MTGPDYDECLEAVRAICADLPEVSERLSHGAPTFFIRSKKTLVMVHDDHHGDGRRAVWCPAPPGVQAEMVDTEPDRFFVPPYVGHRGWLGVRLDQGTVDWDELAAIITDAYRHVGPVTLVRQLDAD